MSCSASSACCCVSATTTATGSPAKRTRSVASTVIPEPGTMPEGCGGKWLSTSWGTQITGRGMIDATSGPVKTRTTPGADLAAEVSIDAIRAWPCGLRRIDAYAIPGRETSAMNLSSPRSMAGASVGGTEAPQRLPSSQARISADVGSGFRESRSATDIITPGVVNPSWVANASQNPSWIGERAPSCASPSTVVTCDPSAEAASTMQLLVALPSRRTVHAPHSPVSQPTFVPVSPSRSRNASIRSSPAATSTDTSVPLTVRELRTTEPLSDTSEVVCDLAVAHHEAVVDLPLTGLLGVHRRLEDDRVFGLVELVGRPKREVPDHVEVPREELLELVAALDVELAGQDLCVLRVVVGDQAVDVLVEEVLDVALVEAEVGGVEIFHGLPHFPRTSTSLSPKAEDDSTDRAVTKGWS